MPSSPLDPYIEKYGVKSEFDDINPAFKDWMSYQGKIYGLVVDGDVLVTYYRKDLFEDPENQSAFKAKYGYDLGPPKDYTQFGDIACFLTEKYQPDTTAPASSTPATCSSSSASASATPAAVFDPETMKATVNSDAGVKVLTEMVEQNKCMAPGIETWGFAENLSALNAGQIAMTISWPPLGRLDPGSQRQRRTLSWVPQTTVADKIGYAINPGGHPELASGFINGVSPDSKNKDAAYLYIQWMHSKDQSLQNVASRWACGTRTACRTTRPGVPGALATAPTT